LDCPTSKDSAIKYYCLPVDGISTTLDQENETMKQIYKLSLWLPFVFSIVLSGIVLNASHGSKASTLPPELTSFLCFLPMAFYMVAQATAGYVSKMEKRLDTLETQLKALNH
jgi:hypothetical protein